MNPIQVARMPHEIMMRAIHLRALQRSTAERPGDLEQK